MRPNSSNGTSPWLRSRHQMTEADAREFIAQGTQDLATPASHAFAEGKPLLWQNVRFIPLKGKAGVWAKKRSP